MFRWRIHKTGLFGLLFLFILVLGAPVLAADAPGNYAGPVVVVTASGTTSVAPDQARLHLAVVSNARELAQAQNENNSITQKVMDALRASGVDQNHIQTSGFNIYPEYDYNSKSGLVGYQVRNEIMVVVKDISKVGVILDKAVAAGVNNVNYISFEKAELDAAENEALLKAIARGRDKAHVIAAAAQMDLGGLLSISEGYNPSTYSNVANITMDSLKGMGGGMAVPITPGELKVNATVTMVYQLR